MKERLCRCAECHSLSISPQPGNLPAKKAESEGRVTCRLSWAELVSIAAFLSLEVMGKIEAGRRKPWGRLKSRPTVGWEMNWRAVVSSIDRRGRSRRVGRIARPTMERDRPGGSHYWSLSSSSTLYWGPRPWEKLSAAASVNQV